MRNQLVYIVFVFCFLVWIMTGCERQVILKDHLIPNDLKQKIHSLNDSIINYIAQKDTASFALIASQFLKNVTPLDSLNLSGLQTSLNSTDRKILNEYYFFGSLNIPIKFTDKNAKGEGYTLEYTSVREEEYISLLKLGNGKLLILIYGKEKDEWLLDGMIINSFKFINKNVYQWYESAKSDYQEGNILWAYRDICFTNGILGPSGGMYYFKHNEILRFIEKVSDEFKEKFVYELNVLTSKPTFIAVYWARKGKIFFPEVWYKTNLSLTDTIAIHQECDQIHQSFWKLYTGKEEINKTVYYNVCQSTDQKVSDWEIIKE